MKNNVRMWGCANLQICELEIVRMLAQYSHFAYSSLFNITFDTHKQGNHPHIRTSVIRTSAPAFAKAPLGKHSQICKLSETHIIELIMVPPARRKADRYTRPIMKRLAALELPRSSVKRITQVKVIVE